MPAALVARRVVTVALAAALSGACTKTSLEPSSAQSPIASFVAAENLPAAQGIASNFKQGDVEEFSVAYGSAQDCFSGCFYSSMLGLRSGQKVGWIRITDYQVGHTLSPARRFDVAKSDTALFSADLWAAMDLAESSRFSTWTDFMPLLAGDSDTPRDALERIAQRIQDKAPQGTFVAAAGSALVENPAVQSDVTVLTVLANLPNLPVYKTVRDRAQQLLKGLGGS